MKNSLFAFIPFVLLLLLNACGQQSEHAHKQNFHSSDPLVSTTQLFKLLPKNSVKILDVREAEDFLSGHIPGAQNISRSDMENPMHPTPGMMATRKQFQYLLGKLGIKPSDFIVVYDNNGNPDASRLYWMLDFYGHKFKAMLNGGLAAWKKENKKLSTAVSQVPFTNYLFQKPSNPTILATKEEVRRALSDSNYVLIDCRGLEEFKGSKTKEHASRKGRIPGSISLNYNLNLNEKDALRFKEKARLKALYKGIPRYKKIICYCHSGVRSSLNTFVLRELLHYPNVKNYDGSWIEWSRDKNLPVSSH